MTEPYYQDDLVTLWHGKAEEILPTLGRFDLAIVDPPYAETSLSWDRWIPGLPDLVADATDSMWCFGSMRMFLRYAPDFEGWKFGQDVVWEKHNGSGLHNDRFKRVHEHALHWYRGPWAEIYHETPKTLDATARTVRQKARPVHHQGATGPRIYTSRDGGPRLMRSVIYQQSMHGRALHPTEKPAGILAPLMSYACPPGGSVIDPTAGSGSTLAIARLTGRRAVGIEVDERYCEVAAQRLDQGLVPLGEVGA